MCHHLDSYKIHCKTSIHIMFIKPERVYMLSRSIVQFFLYLEIVFLKYIIEVLRMFTKVKVYKNKSLLLKPIVSMRVICI